MNAQVIPERETMFDHIGRLLNLKVTSEADLFRISQTGVSNTTFKRAITVLDIPIGLIGPETTMRRRLDENQRLKPSETERLLRVARVYAEAVSLFGDETAAKAWMNTPAEFVPDQPASTPAQLSAFDSGARLIEAKIKRTAYGIF